MRAKHSETERNTHKNRSREIEKGREREGRGERTIDKQAMRFPWA